MPMFENFLKEERRAEQIISAVAFVVMVIMVSINVFCRYLLRKSFAFSEEIAYIAFNWSVFIGMCNIFRTRALVAVDVFVDRLRKRAQAAVGIFTDVCLIVVNVVLAYFSLKLAISGWARRTPYLMIPYTFMYMPAVISFVILSISSISLIIQNVKCLKEGGNPNG